MMGRLNHDQGQFFYSVLKRPVPGDQTPPQTENLQRVF